MTVVFDARPLCQAPITGVGRAFLTALAAYRPRAEQPCAVLWPDRCAPPPELAGFELVAAPAGALATQARLPSLLRRLGARVLHSPVAAVPLRAPCAVVATVHDLPWMAPGGAPDADSLRRRAATRTYLRRAERVLVPSRATAADLVAWAGAASGDKTRVVPHGVPQGFASFAEPGREDRAAPGPLLVLGDDRPRKNLPRVFAAHALARSRCPDLPDLERIGPPSRYVSEEEKWRRLRSSRGLVHCSLWEGFGLPVLEAMVCGVPVLASRAASLPEVCGDAALLVDPEDPEAIAAGMVRLHRDEALRAELQRQGRRRAAAFPPERPAEQWRALHRELTGRSREKAR